MSDTLGSISGLSGIPPIWKLALAAVPLARFQFERLAAAPTSRFLLCNLSRSFTSNFP